MVKKNRSKKKKRVVRKVRSQRKRSSGGRSPSGKGKHSKVRKLIALAKLRKKRAGKKVKKRK
ncbi:hypothetical protein HYU22_02785 [Candidatus Woesearchaeota archaeon]|nr:hypothetical protein [Candidatus Woesearchaeota archaeon]